MVDKSYMLSEPPAPSPLKRYFDQAVLPAAIDAAGYMEAGLERLAMSVKQRPAVVLGAALVVGAACSSVLFRIASGRRRSSWR